MAQEDVGDETVLTGASVTEPDAVVIIADGMEAFMDSVLQQMRPLLASAYRQGWGAGFTEGQNQARGQATPTVVTHHAPMSPAGQRSLHQLLEADHRRGPGRPA